MHEQAAGGLGRRRHRAEGPSSIYRPGMRSPAWQRWSPRSRLKSSSWAAHRSRSRRGAWGFAVMLDLVYKHW